MLFVKLYGWTLIPLGTAGLPAGEVHAKGGVHADTSPVPRTVLARNVCEDFLATDGITQEAPEKFPDAIAPSISTL
jgi:hypothetical protein